MAAWGLAVAAHVSPSMISAIEKWDYRPGPDVRDRIAAALGAEAEAVWPACEAPSRRIDGGR